MRKFADREQAENSSKTEATLILCGSSGERANYYNLGHLYPIFAYILPFDIAIRHPSTVYATIKLIKSSSIFRVKVPKIQLIFCLDLLASQRPMAWHNSFQTVPTSSPLAIP